MFDDGLRVEDIECYGKLVRFMRKATSKKVVLVKENDRTRNVTLHGFLRILRGDVSAILNKQASLEASTSTKSVFTDIFL